MSFDYIKKTPTKEEVISKFPVSEELKKIRMERIEELKSILRGDRNQFIVIIGPCSADREDAVLDYMHRLKKISDNVKDKLFIIPRVYTNKPRTTGEGYKGMLHQPDINEKPDMEKGLYSIRKLHIKVLEETGLIAADEMLYPENFVYLEDVLGYVAIGARSVENQQHRLVSSGMEMPVGMKNPTSGDLSIMFNSIYAAQKSHNFIYHGYEVQSSGNEYAHSILRGYVNKAGQSMQNYHYEDLVSCIKEYDKKNLKNPSIIVDSSHSNSNKQYSEQPRVVSEILHSRRHSDIVNQYVKGVMVESYIEDGAQSADATDKIYGKSVTDACLGFEKTEKLLYNMAEKI